MTNRKITACIITYNHENFIEVCLKGAVEQKVNCEYEIIIGDDNSSDQTQAICKKFAEKYPTIIKYNRREKNLGMVGNWIKTIDEATGDYIAICEGDDYWTNANKLQSQLDFMENNSGYSLCFHDARDLYDDGSVNNVTYCNKLNKASFTIDDVVNFLSIPTLSIFFRRDTLNIPSWFNTIPICDWPLFMLLSKEGNFFFIQKEMGVYRKHSGGINSLRPTLIQNLNRLKVIILIKKSDEFINVSNVQSILKEEITKLTYFQSLLYLVDRSYKTSLTYYFKVLFYSSFSKLIKQKLLYPFRFLVSLIKPFEIKE